MVLTEQNITMEDWMNPESPYYYKGYRYEKDEYNDEYWYDEDGNVRKEIVYWSNGNKSSEYYFNEKGCYHNEDGFAYNTYSHENGELEEQLYYLNGERLTEQQWKEEVIKLKPKNTPEIKMEENKNEPIISVKEDNKHKGLRYNNGKLRYDLLPEFPIRELTKVLTKGAEKYEPYNWKRGMSWSSVLASMKRHISEFENCEDFDKESGCYHMAHVMANAAFLLEFYKVYPQGDDRQHKYLNPPKIGLDIDEVIADWVKHWCEYHKMDEPIFWNFDKDIKEKFESLKDNKDFWMSIPRKIDPNELPFEPHCYITSRNIPTEWTMEWLQNNGFPSVPVYTVGMNQSKVQVAKESGIDWFVDDRYENFHELNTNGICTFLMDAKHNRRYNVGYKRIYSLNDLVY